MITFSELIHLLGLIILLLIVLSWIMDMIVDSHIELKRKKYSINKTIDETNKRLIKMNRR